MQKDTNALQNLTIILHIQSLAVGKGGAERVATDLADQLRIRGHNLYMAYRDNGPPAYNATQDIGYLPYKSIKDLKQIVREINPSVFFSFYVNHLIFDNYSVVYDSGIPFGMQECTNPTRAIENNWRRGQGISIWRSRWEREIVASGAHRIRLVMPDYVKSFPEYIRRQSRGFSNPAFPQDKIASHKKPTDVDKVIVNIGGMKENKNFPDLLKAFIEVKDEFPEWKIYVFGKDDSAKNLYISSIKKLINNHSLYDRVIIRGPSNDIFGELAKADLHVISSLEEGCPTCVLEAMATGLPSIGFDSCPGTNELIVDGINGLLADSKNPVQSLACSLRKLMSSPELRMKYGAAAISDSKSFSPDVIYSKWEQLFYEAASYKDNIDRLFEEQMQIDPERALHARRMREKLMKSGGYV